MTTDVKEDAMTAKMAGRDDMNRAGSLLSADDLHYMGEGRHFALYHKLGAQVLDQHNETKMHFAVWAPNAEYVSVIGDFNNWRKKDHPLKQREHSGIWEGWINEASEGDCYKYYIESPYSDRPLEKADPYAFHFEVPPSTASKVWTSRYQWQDSQWMDNRRHHQHLEAPMAIYEMHIGSWLHVPEEDGRPATYREIAPKLAQYLNDMGFTHVEMLPVMEHPFYGSWGYQTLGYFAPTSRFGTPDDFKYLVDYLHQYNIGVILDWVPSHFPNDPHGLYRFDGTHLYEHADPRKGYHPDWHSAIFNYGRNEVRCFLISSAMFWLDEFHIDGLRVDAVASMLYLDYSREEGEWVANEYGGNENLEAIDFIRQFNETVYGRFPDTLTIAEESTAWGGVSKPTYVGGLGFGYKWDMGWMHDTLLYMSKDPLYRTYHHGELTFRQVYAFTENFVLPLSHDEVVHGKSSMIGKMPGPEWQKFANLRLLYSYMYSQPGKKLLFMGADLAQWSEWNHEDSLEWHLLQYPQHQGIQNLLAELNHLYINQPALHEGDCHHRDFEWVECHDATHSVIAYLRHSHQHDDTILVVLNATPEVWQNYRLGVPCEGFWRERLNSDSEHYGGSNQGNNGGATTENVPSHDRPFSVSLTLPPLSVLFLRCDDQ